MNEEFTKKLIEELEENRRKHMKLAEGQPRETLIKQYQFAGCFGKAIEVVKKVAKEYQQKEGETHDAGNIDKG